ncbi:MAG TPA: hypothetical protein V6D17_11560 [Candidatus Obscuribacterales bacterium]
MNPRTKVLIANKDGAKLISLLLWLEQYGDLEVTGTTSTELACCLNETAPDVVLMDLNVHSELETSFLRNLRNAESAPAFLLMHESEVAPIESTLSREFDGHISPRSSLKELADAVRKAANKRSLAISAARIPNTKAG